MSFRAKVPVMCIATLACLAAFASTSAQAEDLTDGGEVGLFRVLGSGPLAIGVRAQTATEESPKLLIPGANLLITCEAVVILNSVATSDTTAFVEVLFPGCLTFVLKTNEQMKSCVIEDFKAGDRMITATGYAKPKKHNGKNYILFESVKATIVYQKETTCPLPHENEVTGSLVAEILEGETEYQLLKFSEPIQKLLGDTLKFDNSVAYADGSVTAWLLEDHFLCKWGVV